MEFRLRHLKDPRARAVIEAAAQGALAAQRQGNDVRGRGIAFARYKNLAGYVAVVAEVTVDRKSGKVRITRAVSAVDVGQIVNPDGVTNQIEGGIIQSASWTLMEAVRFDRTRVTTQSWADYPILRFEDVPQVEVVLLNRPEERFLGVGEGAQGPTGAAIANAMPPASACRGYRSRRSGSGRQAGVRQAGPNGRAEDQALPRGHVHGHGQINLLACTAPAPCGILAALARRLTTLRPATALAEALATTRLPRVAGLTGRHTAVVTLRPRRAPHHTISDVGLVWGSQLPLPGGEQ